MENTMTMSKSYEQKMLERRSELFEQARGDEVLEKRRENIKQFHLGHDRYQAVVFPEPTGLLQHTKPVSGTACRQAWYISVRSLLRGVSLASPST